MPDHKQPFDKRISNNTSENNFEELCHYRDILFYKYGIDNHPFGKTLYKVNRKIRNTPDYIVVRDVAYFIEVKGLTVNNPLDCPAFTANLPTLEKGIRLLALS